ncbi:hypothetical protein F0L68_37125 [Solihabitans fulvus]|uniref:Uncharacterized protein n=1 Tax=Solihabitans fulvus TaxID=1892852 RepID=A0A5B2WKI7_9PSEU|nr:hypothetical protein [Solihabitans fulvus]KAA2251438.1 hypothetical protein F0L68_37125 [Solihabitans fulvus]
MTTKTRDALTLAGFVAALAVAGGVGYQVMRAHSGPPTATGKVNVAVQAITPNGTLTLRTLEIIRLGQPPAELVVPAGAVLTSAVRAEGRTPGNTLSCDVRVSTVAQQDTPVVDVLGCADQPSANAQP